MDSLTTQYSLPRLPYEYAALGPQMSETQLTLHHQKHHQAYVTGANGLMEKMSKSRRESTDLDMKATLKELSFHIGGHYLHSLFWENLGPSGKTGGGMPQAHLLETLTTEFGTFERFKKEFTQAASSTEGSGWAALAYCQKLKKPLVMQIEKHNLNIYPGYSLLMVLDLWEHAYYVDYKNDRARYIEAFWNIVNWDAIEKRLRSIQKQ